jgi:hypothetical protein
MWAPSQKDIHRLTAQWERAVQFWNKNVLVLNKCILQRVLVPPESQQHRDIWSSKSYSWICNVCTHTQLDRMWRNRQSSMWILDGALFYLDRVVTDKLGSLLCLVSSEDQQTVHVLASENLSVHWQSETMTMSQWDCSLQKNLWTSSSIKTCCIAFLCLNLL